jgi:hypothetical protein
MQFEHRGFSVECPVEVVGLDYVGRAVITRLATDEVQGKAVMLVESHKPTCASKWWGALAHRCQRWRLIMDGARAAQHYAVGHLRFRMRRIRVAPSGLTSLAKSTGSGSATSVG